MTASISLMNITSHVQSRTILPEDIPPPLFTISINVAPTTQFLKKKSSQHLFLKRKSDHNNPLPKTLQNFVRELRQISEFLIIGPPVSLTSFICHRPSQSLHSSRTGFFQLLKCTKLFPTTRNLSLCYSHPGRLCPPYLT